ncbi:unnamed protein product [Merluccius merluccius]
MEKRRAAVCSSPAGVGAQSAVSVARRQQPMRGQRRARVEIPPQDLAHLVGQAEPDPAPPPGTHNPNHHILTPDQIPDFCPPPPPKLFRRKSPAWTPEGPPGDRTQRDQASPPATRRRPPQTFPWEATAQTNRKKPNARSRKSRRPQPHRPPASGSGG